MNPLKRLAGQTVVYGLPSILGRFLGYLLVPLYTRVFLPDAYGTVTVFYSYAAFLMVILTYGMETAFFKFNQKEENKDRVYSSGLASLVVTSLLFLLIASLFSQTLANWMGYPGNQKYVIWFAWILGLDALSAIPFARLRAQNKAFRFAMIKMVNILTNISLNLFFILLCPYILHHTQESFLRNVISLIYRSDWGIEYIFISNLAASAITLVLLTPQFTGFRWQPDRKMIRALLVFAFPLLFAGMAGIVNETFDRIMLRYLLPMSPKMAEAQVGIYGACYKISILMTLFIQAYRFAAEPFFFAQSGEKNAKAVYAKIMDYFIITVSVIFLVTMLYLDDFVIRFIGRRFTEGKNVIPILMLANLCLGVYYNLSIWYKLTSQTIWGAWLSIIGAVITLILNFWWIPLGPDHLIHGYLGSAWATLICYASMMILSYLIGQRYFPVNYNLKKFFGYLGLAVILWFISSKIIINSFPLRIIIHTLFLFMFILTAVLVEKPRLRRIA